MHCADRVALFCAVVTAAAPAWAQPAQQGAPIRHIIREPFEPGPRAPLRQPVVNVRLSEDLGAALPEVRAALDGLESVRIAEPADFELTTKADFPLTLVAVNLGQASNDWQNDFSIEPVRPRPMTFELGNLGLNDYAPTLREVMERAGRANLLLAQGNQGQTADLAACIIIDMQADPATERCHRGAMRPGTDEFASGTYDFAARVSNASAKPRYVALLLVDPNGQISHLPSESRPAGDPLLPGTAMTTQPLPFAASMNVGGNYVLVTVSSDRPIDLSAFVPAERDNQNWERCMASAARDACARAPASIPLDWSVSLAEFHYHVPRKMGIGGGLSVAEGMAAWMAEIYSTIPFKPKDIAADSLLPDTDKSKKHLAQRSAAERDHRCGGTLIGANLLLTAAHCVANEPFSPATMSKVFSDRRVRVGTLRLGKGGSTMAIDGIAIPAGYVPGRQEDDIALLLLRPDRGTKRAPNDAVRVGNAPIAAGTDVTAFGWGYTGTVPPGANPMFNISSELQRNPEQLRYGNMRVLRWSDCRRRLKEKLGPGMVCLVAPGAETGAVPEKNVFSCRGDSGGPLVRKAGAFDELIGVTSWSLGCGFRDIPSVYTDVTKYRRWIEAARRQIRPGATLRIDEKAAPLRQEGRRQSAQ